jgi:mxaA protein
VPAGFTLDSIQQPDTTWPGWLEVRERDWKARGGSAAPFYDFRYLYQIFYVADSVTTLEIPARPLVFRSERTGEALWATLPPFRFSLSPLTDSTSTLGPDLSIAPPSARWIRWSGAALGALCLWAVLLAVGHRRRWRVFRRARRDVRRARDCGEALLRIHRALEARAGRALFAHDLEALTDRWPAAEEVRGELERFFGLSDAVFYGNGGEPSEDCLQWARELAHRLATLERRDGRRRSPAGRS